MCSVHKLVYGLLGRNMLFARIHFLSPNFLNFACFYINCMPTPLFVHFIRCHMLHKL
ncbi:hypothetical protein KSP40_PGU021753 [Platanthera guangdongensis]|uniref:Uncharacterized protein n=1 Tax=Platanthera guangdongensis TaxID=2320717 RepID=A0ABR2N3J5_9ASPA